MTSNSLKNFIIELSTIFYIENQNISQCALYDAYKFKEMLPYVCIALYRLQLYKKLRQIIELNLDLLDYYEIQKVVLKMKEHKNFNIHIDFNKDPLNFELNEDIFLLNKKSTIKYLSARSEQNCQKLLIESFKLDNRNFGALFEMINKSIIDTTETLDFIKENVQNIQLQEILYKILTLKIYEINTSIFLLEVNAIKYYNKLDKNNLLRCASILMDDFTEMASGHIFMGYYYILEKDYHKANKLFYHTTSIEENNLRSIIGLGLTQLSMKDEFGSNICFNKARDVSSDSFLPYYILSYKAIQHRKYEDAMEYIEKSLSISNNENNYFLLCYICFKMKKFDNVREIMNKVKNNSLLFILYFIYHGNYIDGDLYLNNGSIERDARFIMLNGYISQLRGNFQKARDFYEACKSMNPSHHLINVLIKMIDDKSKGSRVLAELDSVFDFVMDIDNLTIPLY